MSRSSASSSYVDFETLFGLELIASGRISRFLAVCLDDDAFALASEHVRFFNIVRKGFLPEAVARLIQGNLISASQARGRHAHPFLGREDEMIELETQVTDHRRPVSRALYISGNAGAGRRTIAQKFYEAQYPNVGRVLPTVSVEEFSGLEELYRRVLTALRPTITISQLKTHILSFDVSPVTERPWLIAQLLNSLLLANEATYLVDGGGLLTDAGSLAPEINDVVSLLEARPHPPIVLIAPRMIPKRLRRQEDDMSYLAVRSLKRDASVRLISKLLRDRGLSVSDDGLDYLVRLSDGHPFNFYRMVEEVSDRGLEPFLANPSDFIDWKHRQSSEYLKKVHLGDEEILILALLKVLPELDFASIVGALPIDDMTASEALLKLGEFHIIETTSERFTLAPALRVAVERDKRIKLSPSVHKEAVRKLAQALAVRIEEGTAPISLVDTAVLSSLEAGENLSGFVAAFLLPSHYVWIAKRYYDQKHWEESIRSAKEALKGSQRLSLDGRVAAFRYLCLSAARIGDEDTFESGILELERVANSNWAGSNVAFLRGFNLRFKGNLPSAESMFRRSYDLSPGNLSAAREIAAICLARGRLDQAEQFAREAHSHARSNPYFLDILLAVLIRKHGREARHMSEINDMFSALEKVDRESNKSFYTTRRAEFEHLWGDGKNALKLIEEAVDRTPWIFEPRRLYAVILLKDSNKVKALQQIEIMREIVNARDPSERRSNYRLYLEVYSNYLLEIGRYADAKNIYNDLSVFDDEERLTAVRDIELVQGFKNR